MRAGMQRGGAGCPLRKEVRLVRPSQQETPQAEAGKLREDPGTPHTHSRPPFPLLPNSLAPLPSGVRSRLPRYCEPFSGREVLAGPGPFLGRGPWTLGHPLRGVPGSTACAPGSGGDSGLQAVAPGSACRRSCVRYGAVHTRASLQLPRLLAERLGLLLLPQKIKALGRGLIGFCCRKGSVLMKRAS